MKKSTTQPLLVTTVHKGVFFGYGQKPDENAKTIRIERARMCVYWSTNVHGVLGLAANGPTKDCRIGPQVPAITLQDVTAVIEVSEKAAAAMEGEPWN